MATTSLTDLLPTAYRYHKAHLNIIPVRQDKRPACDSWKQYMKRFQTIDEVETLFGRPQYGIAIICGQVSGGVTCIDIDTKNDKTGELARQFAEILNEQLPGISKMLIQEQTPSGGFHLVYRCSKSEGNQKLAKNKNREVLIETRGEGGYFCCDPTPNYQLLSDSPQIENIQEITPEQQQTIFNCARAFNECESDIKPYESKTETEIRKSGVYETLPLDDYNARTIDTDVLDLLTGAGWKVVRKLQDNAYYLQRPGKSGTGISASYNKIPGRLYVFSSSTIFESERSFTPAAIYAFIQHNGDFKAAAHDLSMRGYGKKREIKAPESQDGDLQLINQGTMDPQITETWMGTYIARTNQDILRKNHTSGYWHIWDKSRWKRDDKRLILGIAQESVRKCQRLINDTTNGTFDAPLRAKMHKQTLKFEALNPIKAALEFAASIPELALTEHELDGNPFLLNCQNGTYNLSADRFQEHNQTDLISKCSGAHYQEGAKAERWAAFLQRIFDNNSELIEYIQTAVGYSLSGAVHEQCLFFAYGKGANGKSVFFDVLAKLFGDYWQKAPTSMLMEKKTAEIPNDVARLRGARFVVASELQEGQRFHEAIVKDLTGSDVIVARFLHREFFEFRPTHKLWIYGNHKPIIRGTDTGIWRRIQLIPFTVTIPEPERIPLPILVQQLTDEMPGILNWAINGYKSYKFEGLRIPKCVLEATKGYQEDSDTLGQFIEECCDQVAMTSVANSELYKAYETWCKNNGDYQLSNRRFCSQLRERGFEAVKGAGNAMMWQRLSLKNDL